MSVEGGGFTAVSEILNPSSQVVHLFESKGEHSRFDASDPMYFWRSPSSGTESDLRAEQEGEIHGFLCSQHN